MHTPTSTHSVKQLSISTENAAAPRGFYSQAVRAGQFLYIAGQLPLDPEGSMVQGGIEEQTRMTLRNIQSILQAAGGEFSNLVMVTIYISDIAHWPTVNRIYEELLGTVPVPPARAVVPVKDLHYGALLEIQATAFFS